jgi:competence protein ComEC
MNPFFARIPLVRLLVPFLLGIAAVYSFGFPVSFPVFVLVLLLSLVLIATQRGLLRRSVNWSGLDGMLIAIAFFFTGSELTGMAMMKPAHEIPVSAEKEYPVYVRLIKDPVVKERSVKLCVRALAADSSGQWKDAGEKLMLYLGRDPAAEKLRYGDELLVSARISLLEGPKNPCEFDYRDYLLRQDIRKQGFSKSGEWKLASRGNGNFFMAMALDLRRYFRGKLLEYGLNGAEGGVASALLLGASDQLDPGLLQAYSASGTLHVLSVSGMHVALVYLVLMKLMAPMQKRRTTKWISFFIQLVFLWFYAALTGLSPSVLRSVTMLSVVIAGRAFGRQAHILNSLAASALILLIADPLLLYDVGFQLSYLAVAGIVLLQPKLDEKWSTDNWLLQQVWGLLTVTIAAQVFTFPLGLYYFRQFPSYFILSNLVVIPLSTVTMYAGLLLLIVSPFAFLARPVAWIFSGLIRMLNFSVEEIEQLPRAVLQCASWKPVELLLLYIFVILLLFFLFRRRGGWFNVAGICLLFLFAFIIKDRKVRFTGSELVIFRLNQASAIGLVNGEEAILLSDSSLAKKEGDIDFHIHPYFEDRGIYDETIQPLSDSLQLERENLRFSHSWLFAGRKKIFIAGRHSQPVAVDACDILLIRGSPKIPLEKFIAQMHPKMIVTDGSDGKAKTEKWAGLCAQLHVPFYDVKTQGALLLSIE